jgi:hypothetical protein
MNRGSLDVWVNPRGRQSMISIAHDDNNKWNATF